MSFLKKKRNRNKSSSSVTSTPSKSTTSTLTSGLTSTGTSGRAVITCAILLMEAPGDKQTSSTPAGRKKFEVLQVSFTQDATIRSVLQNVKLQSSHNSDSLASSTVGLCRPSSTSEFVNSFSIKKYDVKQNELLLGIPEGLTATQTQRHSENMRKSSKLKALLQSMEIQKTIDSPADGLSTPRDGASPENTAPPLSPSYVVYAGPKKQEEQKFVRASVFVPQNAPTESDKDNEIQNVGSNLEVVEDTRYDASDEGSVTGSLKEFFSKGFDSAEGGTGTVPKIFILLTAFVFTTSLLNIFFNNRSLVSDLPSATLSPGSTMTHISFLSKSSITPPPLNPVYYDVAVKDIATLPTATRNLAKNVATKISTFQSSIAPPPPQHSELTTRISPSMSKLTLNVDGELTLHRGSELVWSQKGAPGSNLVVTEDNELKLGRQLVVVKDSALASSWPFSGFVTAITTPIMKHRRAIVIAAEVTAAVAITGGLGRKTLARKAKPTTEIVKKVMANKKTFAKRAIKK